MKQSVHAFVISRLDYCNSILAGLSKGLLSQLQRVQNAAARLVLGLQPRDHVKPALYYDWLAHPSINQEERRRDKTPAHSINVQSLRASVGESQVVDTTSAWHMSITESRSASGINHNTMLSQQFLSAIRQISSELFIFQQDSAPPARRTVRLRQSTCPIALPLLLNNLFFSKQTRQ